MQVTINGKPHQLAGEVSLAQAVALLTSAPSGVAAAVNGAVVPRAAWSGTALAEDDDVEVLTAVQGG